MGRWVRLALVSIVLLAVVMGVIVSSNYSDPAAAALSGYTTYRANHDGKSVVVQQSVRADLPQNFTATMSGASFSQGYRYATSFTYENTPVIVTSVYSEVLKSYSGSSGHPLPYPPVEVRCVRLEEGGESKVVLLARHQDLYLADWVVHEPAADADLSRLKCRW